MNQRMNVGRVLKHAGVAAFATLAIAALAAVAGCRAPYAGETYSGYSPSTVGTEYNLVKVFPDGSSIEGIVVEKVRASSRASIVGVKGFQGVLENFEIRVDVPDGNCYLFGVRANPVAGDVAAATPFDDLAARVSLHSRVKVSGFDPSYTGQKNCKGFMDGVTVSPSQIEVVR